MKKQDVTVYEYFAQAFGVLYALGAVDSHTAHSLPTLLAAYGQAKRGKPEMAIEILNASKHRPGKRNGNQ